MSHVFISCQRAGEDRVVRLLQALEQEGRSPGWDRGLVRSEDGRTRKRGALVPMLLDQVGSALGFGEMQAWRMIGWKGRRSDPPFADLCAAVHARLQGRPVPPPAAPLKRVARRLTYGSLGSAALVAVLILDSDQFGVQDGLRSLSVLQPQLGDACGAIGLGDRLTREARIAWHGREPASCAPLRSHIDRFRQGAHHREAAAREATLQLANPQAENPCRAFAATTRFRLTSRTPAVQAWKCARCAAGVARGLEGEAVCALDEGTDQEGEFRGS